MINGKPWCVIEKPDRFIKVYGTSDQGEAAFYRETFFYTHFSAFTPKLLSVNYFTLSLEKCQPLVVLSNGVGSYVGDPQQDALELWHLLLRLARRGGCHGDINLVNVVRHPTRGLLLIDWEKSTLHHGVSRDLFPSPPLDPARNQLVCWDGPWEFCPRNVFGVSAVEMNDIYSAVFRTD